MAGKKLLNAAALAAALLALPAQASRPLQTDDAGVLARGECEWEGGVHRQGAWGSHSTELGVQWGCGAGESSQWSIAASTGRAQGLRTSGLGLSGKTGLWTAPGAHEPTALALAWALSSAHAHADGWHHAGTELTLVGTMSASKHLTVHANAGHARNEPLKQRSTTWGLALEHAGWGSERRVAPMVELFGDDRDRPWVNLGLRLRAAAQRVFVDVSYGRQFASGRPTVVALGFKLGF